jgi:hypothetical protein
MNKYYLTIGLTISIFNLPSAHAALNLVYSQDFNSTAAGTTGSGLNDGSFMVGSGHTVQVYDWQSQFKALWLTPMGPGTIGSFYLPDLNPSQAVTEFSVEFKVLINNFNVTTVPFADGFSFNFGQINDASIAYGGESGIHGANTGDILTVGWTTYEPSGRGIAARYNGSVLETSVGISGLNTQNPAPASAFVPVSINWNSENGLSLSYNNSVIFTDLATGAFSPEAGYQFSFAGRTGSGYQNVFIDDLQVSTVPEPSAYAALAGLLALGFAALRRRVS